MKALDTFFNTLMIFLIVVCVTGMIEMVTL